MTLFDCATKNCASVFTASKGNADAAFRTAHYIQRGQFRVQRMTALPMETRGLLAEWDEATGRLTVSGAAKLPFFNKRAMAAMMNLAEEAVDYIEYDVGGGFGARGEFYPEDYLVAFAARRFGRPVKWIEDRREHLASIAHSRETECDIEYAFDRDGVLLGMRGVIDVDIGAYVRPNGMTPVRNAAQFLSGPYRVANIASRSPRLCQQQDAVRHLSRAGPVRGLLLHRAHAGDGRARAEARSRRDPPPQSRRAQRNAVPARQRGAE